MKKECKLALSVLAALGIGSSVSAHSLTGPTDIADASRRFVRDKSSGVTRGGFSRSEFAAQQVADVAAR